MQIIHRKGSNRINLFKPFYKRLIDPALQRVYQPCRHTDASLAHHTYRTVRAQGNERHLAVRAGPHRVLFDGRPQNPRFLK